MNFVEFKSGDELVHSFRPRLWRVVGDLDLVSEVK